MKVYAEKMDQKNVSPVINNLKNQFAWRLPLMV